MANQDDDKNGGEGRDTGRPKKAPMTEAERREMRRAAALRANLARRKDQARARRAGAADERDTGLPAAGVPTSDSDTDS